MASAASGHFQREKTVLNDLELSFPNFTGKGLLWVHNPGDPPDFLAQTAAGSFGLEFREWLDGQQMSAAQHREDQREHLMEVIGSHWENEYQPKNIALATIEPFWGRKVKSSDEAQLRQEFYNCAKTVDQSWFTNPERRGRSYYQMEFSTYPLMAKHFAAIRYIEGPASGSVWIQAEQDGGAYDPQIPEQTLEKALEDKLVKFGKPERQAKLVTHHMIEHYRLIHGGWNAYVNNTPHHPLTLEQIAKRGAEFYAAHPQRSLFDRVWFFDPIGGISAVGVTCVSQFGFVSSTSCPSLSDHLKTGHA